MSSCPTCGGVVEQPWTGRPAVYCGPDCRAEMFRLRRELGYLEAEIETHRAGLTDRDPIRQDYHRRFYDHLSRMAEPLRARVVPVIRPEGR